MDSPSSIWRSALTQFTVHSGVNFTNGKWLPEQFQHSLTRFSLIFPVGNKKVFGMGIRPIYRINNAHITEQDYSFIGTNESVTGLPIAYRSNYTVGGGLSEIFFTYSFKLNNRLSFGIENNFIFGNYFFRDELITYEAHFDSVYTTNIQLGQFFDDKDSIFVSGTSAQLIIVDKDYLIRGNSFTLEGRYTTPFHELVVNTSITGNFRYGYQITQDVYGDASSTIKMPLQSFGHLDISHFGLGYHYKAGNFLGITTELHRQNALQSFPIDAAIFGIGIPDENSIHLGSYYQIINSKIGFWNNLNLRMGLYYKTLSFTQKIFTDYGGTFGIGIEYLNNTQSLDLALRAGNKESIIQRGKIENYITIHVGISTGEKWFMKRRRK